jgi:hypothetical protein
MSLRFANGIYVFVAMAAVVFGRTARWLTVEETLVGLGLILVPYLTVGYERCMEGQGRYAAVAFPMYLVFGKLLAQLPPTIAAVLVAVAALFLAIYAGHFAAGYVVI